MNSTEKRRVERSSLRRRQVHPGVVRCIGLACLGFVGGFFCYAFGAPRASDALVATFLIGGPVLGAAVGVVIEAMKRGRE